MQFCPHFFKSFAACLLIFAMSGYNLRAQATSSEEPFTYCYNQTILDLGKNGIAVAGSEQKAGATILRYDSTAKQLWSKTYPLPNLKSRKDVFASSADGKDIYALSMENIRENGGTSSIAVLHVDAVTGEKNEKAYTMEHFGHILYMYANSNYLFVFTTYYLFVDPSVTKDPKPKLYRFDRQTLEMKELDHEMKPPTAFGRVFWQVIRVEDDFVEAYVVKEATQHISLELARFDNEGKKIKTTEASFDLEKTFARQTNSHMPLAPGVTRDKYQQNVAVSFGATNSVIIIMVYPMDACYLLYDPASQSYFAYGVCGPGEQKKAGTKHTGIYVAKLDAGFKLLAFKEHADVAILGGDKKFYIHSAPDSRYISAYIGAPGHMMIWAGEYALTVDMTDLVIKKSAEMGPVGNTSGNHMAAPDHLVSRKEVTGKVKQMAGLAYIATSTRQYALVYPFYGGNIKVFADKLE